MKRLNINYKISSIIVFLMLFRVFHLGGSIDSPHAWRQFDTNQYIEGYYYDDAPFLAPTVCWMGGHKTLILEFPLPEYAVAQLYKIFGPHLIVARLFFLLFFVLAMVYLYKSLRLVFDNWVPEFAVLIAGTMPLALYYSTAIHIDFFSISFALAMLYFSMKAIRDQNFKTLLIALGCAMIAMLVKAPYAFYFALPILLYAQQQGKLRWFLYRSPIFVLPVIALILWVKYSKAVNAHAPDWSLIPNYNKFTEMWYWYFGTMNQRSYWQTWYLIAERVYIEVLGLFGSLVALIGLISYKKSKSYWWSLSVLLGTIIYVAIFFNLNLKHNYYQIPFVICCSIFIAMGLQWIYDRINTAQDFKFIPILLIVVTILGEYSFFAEKNYYKDNYYIDRVSSEIRKFTDRDDLVIVSYGGLTPQCPVILQPAGRYGWSIPIHDFKPEQAVKLWKESGASKLAIVYGGYFEGQLQYFYEAMPNKKSVLLDRNGLVLYMCDLDFDWTRVAE